MTAAANGPNPIVGMRSAEVRSGRSAVRRSLRGGTRSLESVLLDRPACLDGVMLFTLMSWRRGWGRDSLRRLGASAVCEQVNLAMTVDMASQRTIDWLIGFDRTMGSYKGAPASGRYGAPS